MENPPTKVEIQKYIQSLKEEEFRSFNLAARLDPKTDLYCEMYKHYKETQTKVQTFERLLSTLD